jgi:tetratricopeptide (TPR) repeat protein
MIDPDFDRWADLMDREATEHPLTAAENEFCREFERRHPACRRELSFYRTLADLDADPDDESRRLTEAALRAMDGRTGESEEGEGPEPERKAPGRRDNRRTRWLTMGGVAAVACAALLLWLNIDRSLESEAAVAASRQPSRVELVYASGEVRIAGKPVVVGDRLLRAGDTVAVKTGSACLAIDPDVDVCLAADSRLRVTAATVSEQRLDLLRGRLTARLDPLPTGSRFYVVSGEVWVTAIGTAFSVEVDPDRERIETTVLEGKVTVGKTAGRKTVRAHQRAVLERDRASVENVVRADESRHWALVRNTELYKARSTAILDLTALPTGVEVWLGERRVGVTPLSALIPVGAHRLELRRDGRVIFEKTIAVHPGHAALSDAGLRQALDLARDDLEGEPAAAEIDPEPELAGADPERADPVGSSRRLSPDELMSSARALMRRGKWARAAATYRELRRVYPDRPEAKTVLVSLGRLELDHLGRPARAMRYLEHYLRGAESALSQEARHYRIRAIRALGDIRQEIEAIRDFLIRHPNSFEARALRKRLHALQSRRAPRPGEERR